MAAIDKMDNFPTGAQSSQDVQTFIDKMYTALSDDLNSPVMIAHLFDAVKFINSVADKKDTITKEDLVKLSSAIKALVHDVLGLYNDAQAGQNDHLNTAMQVLIELRNEAKADKNYALSDAIRDKLASEGIQLMDGKDGTSFSVN